MPRVYSEAELEDMRADFAGYGRGFLYESFAAPDEPEDEEPEADEEPDWASMCPDLVAIYHAEFPEDATLGDLFDAVKAHEIQCAQCLCAKKDVVSDRLYVREGAVCCGEVA